MNTIQCLLRNREAMVIQLADAVSSLEAYNPAREARIKNLVDSIANTGNAIQQFGNAIEHEPAVYVGSSSASVTYDDNQFSTLKSYEHNLFPIEGDDDYQPRMSRANLVHETNS